jgi:two-component system sensor histidine kinase/response regulator
MNSSRKNESNILIVDDTPENLTILARMLTEQGYFVRPAINGQVALQAVRKDQPDLILLDIVMSGMDGYEVCRQLKTDEHTRDIPVLFMSALDETLDKVRAFEVGGVDYITKPFHPEEVIARIETHLTMRNLQKTLQEQNIRLRQEIIERKQAETALKESEQQLRELNVSKDRFFSILAHDLKGPLGSLKGLTQFAEEHLDSYSPNELKEIIVLQRRTAENLLKLLENLLTWSRIQRGILEYNPQFIRVKGVIDRNVALFAPNAEQKQITLNRSIPEKAVVYADFNMVDTVVRNLISNALKFTHSGGTVGVATRQDEKYIEVSVSDTGIGIRKEHLSKLFRIETKYKRSGTAREKGTGLGLILCKELVEQNGGKIWVESEVGKGTTFRFTLPRAH